MSVYFRKSVLGFNKDDVKKYIEEMHTKMSNNDAENKKVINEHKNTIMELSESLNNANENIARLIVENDNMLAELEAFRAEKDKISQLSEVIGKLYLVSKLNAESIINSAKDIKNKSVTEAEYNIQLIEETQEKLEMLAKEINKSSADYNNAVENITNSLIDAKGAISNNYKRIRRSEEKLNEVNAVLNDSVKSNG